METAALFRMYLSKSLGKTTLFSCSEDNPLNGGMTMLTKKYKNVTEYLDKEAMQLKIEKLYRQIDLALENGDRMLFGIIG